MTSASSTLTGRAAHVLGAVVAFVVALALPSAEGLEQTIPCEFDPVDRIVAIGDIHGAYDRFVDNLKATGVVDDELDWIGGATHLVQTGDVLDRGPDSQKAMDLLIKLESQAVASGGRVHALIGNHEFFNAVGQLGFVSEKELEAFEGKRDQELKKANGDVDVRPGELALREAYSASGLYGQWIRTHNAVIRIGDLVFVHGGVTPEVAALGLCGINDRVRADLDSEEWAYSLSMKDFGPLLTRRYSGDDLAASELMERGAEIRQVLETLGARTMVMGHTVTFGLVEPRFEGAAILIDTGMFEGYLGGHQAALVVEGGSFYAVYPNGTVETPGSLAGERGKNYIEAAVAAAPKESALKRQLAALRFRRGEYREAAALYEDVGVLEARARLPYFWRKEAASSFAAIGAADKAEQANELYLQGMRITAERAGVSGVPLLHAYARECLRLDLQTDEAFDAARQAAAAYPKNMSFKVTIAWAWLARGDERRAARVPSLAIRQGEDSFLAYYVLGQAQASLGNAEQALKALHTAQEREPDNEDVKVALMKVQTGTN